MIQGRQEDAHEFLRFDARLKMCFNVIKLRNNFDAHRYLIEALERSFLLSEKVPIKSLDNASKETTPFNQVTVVLTD
jgi:hypothetical protein